MTSITIPIVERDKEALQEKADYLGVKVEDLAQLYLKSSLYTGNDDFPKVMQTILKEDEELLRRLA
jgi:hypothetical protein